VEKKLPTPFFPIGGPPVCIRREVYPPVGEGRKGLPEEPKMLFQKPKTIPASVEIYKAFKELADKHENVKLVNNDGVIELHDQRFPYNPIMMIGKGAVFYDPNDSKTVLEILKNKTR
jgi:hypothetical protein